MSVTYQDIAALHQAGQTADEIAANLTVTSAWWRPLTSREALAWLGESGRMVAIKDAVANTALPAELRGACDATLILLNRPDVAIDLSPGSSHRTMLLGCVQAGVFASADVLALIESTRLRPDPTEADVQAVIDAEARRVRIVNAKLAADSAYASGADDAAIVAAFQGAMA